jgi:hypothetical protein
VTGNERQEPVGIVQGLKHEFWRPQEHQVLVRRSPGWGWGWTINFAQVQRRLNRRDRA